jgi:hypothetical protein
MSIAVALWRLATHSAQPSLDETWCLTRLASDEPEWEGLFTIGQFDLGLLGQN